MTRVVSLSARRSRCPAARTALKISIPEPVFAEIGMVGTNVSEFIDSIANPNMFSEIDLNNNPYSGQELHGLHRKALQHHPCRHFPGTS